MPTVTIVLTVSRSEFLTDVLSGLELLDCDNSYTNLLCIVDGDSKLYLQVRNMIQDTKFNTRLTVQYPNNRPVKKFDYIARRKRITDIHNFAKKQVGICDYVLLTEDDTVVPRNALKSLYTAINLSPGTVFAEGVEMGRWGIPYVGVWKFDDIYEPKVLQSAVYTTSGIEYVDGGGFYCSLIKADVYKNHEFETYESLGPDVSMGLRLRQQGYQCVVDWSIVCKHLTLDKAGNKVVLLPDENITVTTLHKKNANNWSIVY